MVLESDTVDPGQHLIPFSWFYFQIILLCFFVFFPILSFGLSWFASFITFHYFVSVLICIARCHISGDLALEYSILLLFTLFFYCHLFLVVMVTKVFGLNEVSLKIFFNKRPGLHVTWKLMNLPFPESEMGGHSKRAHVCQGCSGWDITGLNKILLF